MWFVLCLWMVDYTVAPIGGDYALIQDALDIAVAGDSIYVESGIYAEQIHFPRSGSQGAGSIRLLSAAGHAPVIDGASFSGGNMVLIENRSYIELGGFEIRNLSGINDGSGIRIIGSGTQLSIHDNHIHHMCGDDAMGITVYGTEPVAISMLSISNNWIHDCEAARSEALTLNGNIDGFEVIENLVTDINNIGIDFIGGETSINPNSALVARNGICKGNTVMRARSIYEGGYAAGIYVDGGRDILIEGNRVTECDLGIEIGAENAAVTTTGVIVRNNWIYLNDKVGLVFGGYEAAVGRTEDCLFLNNTCYLNDTLGEGLGELWIQYASSNMVANNIFVGRPGAAIHYSELGNSSNNLDYNLWFASSGSPEWVWQGQFYPNFASFQVGSGQDSNGLFTDPLLIDPSAGDGHLSEASPAVDRGDPAALVTEVGDLDFDGQLRIVTRVDIGMDELPSPLTCLPSLFNEWRALQSLCGSSVISVLELVGLVSGTCLCPTI